MNGALKQAAAKVRGWRENPLSFFYDEMKFDPDPWQEEFIRVLPSQEPQHKQIALKACTGPGKSAVLAGANLWFIAVFGGPTGTDHPQGLVTSIDQSNLKSGIWKEIAAWRSHSEFLQSAFELTASRLFAKESPNTWFIEARTWAKKADPEAQGRAMSGIHGPFLMATIDECGDIPVSILRVAQQLFSSEHRWAKILGGGNPTSLQGVLYQMCVEEADRTYAISITADPDDPRRAKRTDIENAKRQIALYGRDNPWVKATILGQFPPSSINQLIGIEDVEAAMKRHLAPDQYNWSQRRLGVDCARFGNDRTTLCPRQGKQWFRPVAMRGERTSAISARIITAVHKWCPQTPHEVLIMVDQTGGWGQGTVDQLLVAGYSPLEFVYSTPASMPEYFNIRSQGWMEMAKDIRAGACLSNLPELKKELTAPTFTLRDGKILVEPKELIKARLGASPDLGDGYANTYMMPDMPREMGMAQGRTLKARSEFDPYRDVEQEHARADFDPYRDSV